MLIGKHMVKSWSSTQPVVALSSGEAELYALVRGASQATGLISMLADYGSSMRAKVYVDSSAALGIVHRVGLGKTRHIDTQYLWIQERVNNKQLAVEKVSTHDNPADVLTKNLKAETILKHITALRGRLETKRAETALKINGVVRDQWLHPAGRDGKTWCRSHSTPRLCLFTPMKVARGPLYAQEVGEVRVTYGEYEVTGEKFVIQDNWKESTAPHKNLQRHWAGFTVFSKDSPQ